MWWWSRRQCQIAVSLISGEIGGSHIVDALALQKPVVILLGGKQRLHTGNLELQGNLFLHALLKRRQGYGNFLICVHRGAHRCKQMGIFRSDCVLLIQFQRADKRRFQLGKKVQRTSEKRHMAADRLSAGKTGDGLVDNRLENDAARSSLVAPSLISGWISVFANTPQRAAIG